MIQFHSNGSLNNGCTNCIARAMYDNIAETPDELAFKKDDILTVLEQNTAGLEGWWLCSLRGRQGICPGNRLRLIPGLYEIEQQVLPNCGREQTQLNSDNKQPSWHSNLNKIVSQQKLGDLMYDSPQKSVDSNGYNIPPTNHNRIVSDCMDRPSSIGSSSGCCSDSYDALPSQHTLASKESYDVPKPINIQLTPSSSVSSLSTGGACSSPSGGESNRSSIAHDYDVPKTRTTASLITEFQNVSLNSEDYDVPSNHVQPKELLLSLNSALDCLDKLTVDICSTTTRLLGFASPKWRNQKNLEANISDIKLISNNLKDGLQKIIEFSEGCLGNSLKAPDKGISVKLQPLVLNLIQIFKMINYSINSLDYLGWSPSVLSRDSNVECEYSEDALDKVVSCAKLLTDDIRQITSFIRGNSTLLFKKRLYPQEKEDGYEYVSSEVESKKYEIDSNNKMSINFTDEDKEIYEFYTLQIINQTNILAHCVHLFLQTVEHNRPPSIFVVQVKYVILIAHQLVLIGDTICQRVQESSVKNHVIQCSNALAECISSTVEKSKRAAQLFPSVGAVQEMVDSIIEISHIANDLKISVLKTANT
ncbi:enhancer of filamentation 1 isoform X2 [Adelges cooleyi]|uniref:enhancer of filamentation 1 isoform X2 n=1 Tax=Adelges cooleyi TaxID=133065 RepID=UPI0021800320|nr:enhancer of filamentation 1 isoform X2 [Adelges cooleyi]